MARITRQDASKYMMDYIGEILEREPIEDAAQIWDWWEHEQEEGVPEGQEPIPQEILEWAIVEGMSEGINEEQRSQGWTGWVEQIMTSITMNQYLETLDTQHATDATQRILMAIEDRLKCRIRAEKEVREYAKKNHYYGRYAEWVLESMNSYVEKMADELAVELGIPEDERDIDHEEYEVIWHVAYDLLLDEVAGRE